MDHEVETRFECVRDRVRRPDHPGRKLTDAEVRCTVRLTVPTATLGNYVTADSPNPPDWPDLAQLASEGCARCGWRVRSGVGRCSGSAPFS
jgi:hypothetical protein